MKIKFKKIIIFIMIIALNTPMLMTGKVIAADIKTENTEEVESGDSDKKATESGEEQQVEEEKPVEEEQSNEAEQSRENLQMDFKSDEAQSNYQDSNELAEIKYLYIENSFLVSPSEQNIIVELGEGTEEISNVVLTYVGNNGKVKEIGCSQKENNLYKFTESFDSNDSGIYKLEKINFIQNNCQKEYTFEDLGISACFGVDEECEDSQKSEHVELEYEEENNVDVSIAMVSNEGEEAIASVETALDKSDISTNITTKSVTNNLKKKKDKVVVVLDPGHDSKRTGAFANGLREEELTLKIAKYCRQELEEYSGVDVYLTRETGDCPVPNGTEADCLAWRAVFAQSVGADVFVSLHLNSATAAAANGAEVYYPLSSWKPSVGEEGRQLAMQIQNQLINLGLTDRGIKTKPSESGSVYPDGSIADYYSVIKNCKSLGIPGIIVEHAFVTNDRDANRFLKDDSGLQKLGIADATGIANYFGLAKGRWETVDGKTYYYEGDQKVYGEKQISGKWYYFDPDNNGAMAIGIFILPDGRTVYYNEKGQMQYGKQKIDGKYYYFETVGGAMCKGEEQLIGGSWYYFDDNGEMKIGFHDMEDGRKVYYDENGHMSFWDQTIDGKRYYFDTVGNMLMNKEINVSGKWYFYGSDGVMATGITQLPDGRTVYYNEKGQMQYGKQKIAGKYYYFETVGGAMCKGGEQLIGGCWYYFDDNGVMKIGFHDMADGRKVYYDENGHMSFWDQTIDGKRYYFDTVGNMLINKEVNIEGKWYFYGSDGTMATGITQLPDGRTVYYNEKGQMQYGKQKIAGKYYYFEDVGGAMCKGGEQLIGGCWYYFDDAGVMKIGFHDMADGRKVYYDENGHMSFWDQTIDGKRYYFDTVGNMVRNEEVFTQGGWRYYDGQGQMVIGFYDLPDGRTVYYDKSGYMVFWEQTINGKEYYFDTVGNMLRDGWHNGKYYQPDGVMSENETIEGITTVTAKQLALYYVGKGKSYPEFYKNSDAPTLLDFCNIYIEEAIKQGIKAEVAFCQAMLETNWLNYGKQVKQEQYNFAGLGATDGGASGASFSSVRIGIRAQIQHLQAYASSEGESGLAESCVDPRYGLVVKGCAKYVEWLGQNENPDHLGWATAPNYGYNILRLVRELRL